MRVRMKTQYAGPAGAVAPGVTIDLPKKEAKALVDGGYAETVGPVPRAPVNGVRAAETATMKPPETR